MIKLNYESMYVLHLNRKRSLFETPIRIDLQKALPKDMPGR